MSEMEKSSTIPIELGHRGWFQMYALTDTAGREHAVLYKEPLAPQKPWLVRVHSECLTGDVFGSLRCDCGEQKDAALDRLAEEGGMLIYLRQEGRGIGLSGKMEAYDRQISLGLDTYEANTVLGFSEDDRTYGVALHALGLHGLKHVRLLTNNPDKIAALKQGGIHVDREPLIIPNPSTSQCRYLGAKAQKGGHLLGDSPLIKLAAATRGGRE